MNTRLDEEAIIQNDTLLPSQFWGELGRTSASAEIRLVSAVLVDAVNCLLGKNKNRKEQARIWFNAGDSGLFSYRDCCNWLNINHEAFWKGLKAFIESGQSVKRVNGHLVTDAKKQRFAWRDR